MKKCILLIFSLVLIFSCFFVSAHEELLDVDDDVCNLHSQGPGGWSQDDILWNRLYNYNGLTSKNEYRHISDSLETITYYVYEFCDGDVSYTWDTDVSPTEATAIKNAIVNSLLSWNNVYYYTYDNGVRTSHKLVNIVPGGENSNIVIFPSSSYYFNNYLLGGDYVGVTIPDTSYDTIIEQDNNNAHIHCSRWKMYFDVSDFSYSSNIDSNIVDCNRLRAGAHEFGHVLGLSDIECNNSNYSHRNQIMAFISDYDYSGSPQYNYAMGPSYYDISGAVINRGMHSDDDHLWIKVDKSPVEVRCLICNCKRTNVNIVNNTYEGQTLETLSFYNGCIQYEDSIHSTYHYQNNSMTLLSTNGNQDFFKCMDCEHIETLNIFNRYTINNSFSQVTDSVNLSVAPYYNSVVRFRFGYQITVNSQTSFSISYNYENNNGDTSINLKLINDYFIEINPISETLTNGVKKYTYELNSGIYYIAVKVNAVDMLTPNVNFEFKKVGHTHHYDTAYLWFNLTKHKAFCSCGALTYQPHCVEIVNGNPGTTCLLCGGSASGGFIGPYGGLYFTENGSYICPNGTIVIAEEDLECFYSSEKKFKLFMDYEVTKNQILYFIENKKNVEDDVDENKNNI